MKIIISSCQVLFNFYYIHDDDTLKLYIYILLFMSVFNFFMLYSFRLLFVMASVERWWARVESDPRLLRWRVVGGALPFHPKLSGERCTTVLGHPRALLRRRSCRPGEEVGGRRELLKVHVVAAGEVRRLLRLPRRHPS